MAPYRVRLKESPSGLGQRMSLLLNKVRLGHVWPSCYDMYCNDMSLLCFQTSEKCCILESKILLVIWESSYILKAFQEFS